MQEKLNKAKDDNADFLKKEIVQLRKVIDSNAVENKAQEEKAEYFRQLLSAVCHYNFKYDNQFWTWVPDTVKAYLATLQDAPSSNAQPKLLQQSVVSTTLSPTASKPANSQEVLRNPSSLADSATKTQNTRKELTPPVIPKKVSNTSTVSEVQDVVTKPEAPSKPKPSKSRGNGRSRQVPKSSESHVNAQGQQRKTLAATASKQQSSAQVSVPSIVLPPGPVSQPGIVDGVPLVVLKRPDHRDWVGTMFKKTFPNCRYNIESQPLKLVGEVLDIYRQAFDIDDEHPLHRLMLSFTDSMENQFPFEDPPKRKQLAPILKSAECTKILKNEGIDIKSNHVESQSRLISIVAQLWGRQFLASRHVWVGYLTKCGRPSALFHQPSAQSEAPGNDLVVWLWHGPIKCDVSAAANGAPAPESWRGITPVETSDSEEDTEQATASSTFTKEQPDVEHVPATVPSPATNMVAASSTAPDASATTDYQSWAWNLFLESYPDARVEAIDSPTSRDQSQCGFVALSDTMAKTYPEMPPATLQDLQQAFNSADVQELMRDAGMTNLKDYSADQIAAAASAWAKAFCPNVDVFVGYIINGKPGVNTTFTSEDLDKSVAAGKKSCIIWIRNDNALQEMTAEGCIFPSDSMNHWTGLAVPKSSMLAKGVLTAGPPSGIAPPTVAPISILNNPINEVDEPAVPVAPIEAPVATDSTLTRYIDKADIPVNAVVPVVPVEAPFGPDSTFIKSISKSDMPVNAVAPVVPIGAGVEPLDAGPTVLEASTPLFTNGPDSLELMQVDSQSLHDIQPSPHQELPQSPFLTPSQPVAIPRSEEVNVPEMMDMSPDLVESIPAFPYPQALPQPQIFTGSEPVAMAFNQDVGVPELMDLSPDLVEKLLGLSNFQPTQQLPDTNEPEVQKMAGIELTTASQSMEAVPMGLPILQPPAVQQTSSIPGLGLLGDEAMSGMETHAISSTPEYNTSAYQPALSTNATFNMEMYAASSTPEFSTSAYQPVLPTNAMSGMETYATSSAPEFNTSAYQPALPTSGGSQFSESVASEAALQMVCLGPSESEEYFHKEFPSGALIVSNQAGDIECAFQAFIDSLKYQSVKKVNSNPKIEDLRQVADTATSEGVIPSMQLAELLDDWTSLPHVTARGVCLGVRTAQKGDPGNFTFEVFKPDGFFDADCIVWLHENADEDSGQHWAGLREKAALSTRRRKQKLVTEVSTTQQSVPTPQGFPPPPTGITSAQSTFPSVLNGQTSALGQTQTPATTTVTNEAAERYAIEQSAEQERRRANAEKAPQPEQLDDVPLLEQATRDQAPNAVLNALENQFRKSFPRGGGNMPPKGKGVMRAMHALATSMLHQCHFGGNRPGSAEDLHEYFKGRSDYSTHATLSPSWLAKILDGWRTERSEDELRLGIRSRESQGDKYAIFDCGPLEDSTPTVWISNDGLELINECSPLRFGLPSVDPVAENRGEGLYEFDFPKGHEVIVNSHQGVANALKAIRDSIHIMGNEDLPVPLEGELEDIYWEIDPLDEYGDDLSPERFAVVLNLWGQCYGRWTDIIYLGVVWSHGDRDIFLPKYGDQKDVEWVVWVHRQVKPKRYAGLRKALNRGQHRATQHNATFLTASATSTVSAEVSSGADFSFTGNSSLGTFPQSSAEQSGFAQYKGNAKHDYVDMDLNDSGSELSDAPDDIEEPESFRKEREAAEGASRQPSIRQQLRGNAADQGTPYAARKILKIKKPSEKAMIAATRDAWNSYEPNSNNSNSPLLPSAPLPGISRLIDAGQDSPDSPAQSPASSISSGFRDTDEHAMETDNSIDPHLIDLDAKQQQPSHSAGTAQVPQNSFPGNAWVGAQVQPSEFSIGGVQRQAQAPVSFTQQPSSFDQDIELDDLERDVEKFETY